MSKQVKALDTTGLREWCHKRMTDFDSLERTCYTGGSRGGRT